MMVKYRNVLKCPHCGFEIYTQAFERNCAKCNTLMNFICKESEDRLKK